MYECKFIQINLYLQTFYTDKILMKRTQVWELVTEAVLLYIHTYATKYM